MDLSSLFKRKSAADRVAEREAAKQASGAAPKPPMIDFKQIVEDFRTLDPKNPGLWPLAPRVVMLFALFVILIACAWWFGWNVQMEELQQKQTEEIKLKDDWVAKKKQAVNLDQYKAQLAEINNSFGELLKQLPNESEIGDLLVDINKAAQSRGLLVELFRPGNEIARDFYAEVPISLQLTGSYHDVGAFAGDVAKLPRVVTLNNVELTGNAKDGSLKVATVAKTFRYLDEEEIARKRQAQKGRKK